MRTWTSVKPAWRSQRPWPASSWRPASAPPPRPLHRPHHLRGQDNSSRPRSRASRPTGPPMCASVADRRRAGGSLRRVAWASAYAVLAFGPAALMGFFTPSGTSALTAAADALGLMGLGVLGLQLLLPARWGPLSSSFGTDRLIVLHRSLAGAGTLLVLAHVVLLMVDDPSRLALFEFWSAPTRARLAVVATLALGALSVTSLLRTRLRMSYEGWRRVHLALGLVLVVGGAAHAFLVGHYLARGLLRGLTIGLLGLSLAGVLFLRIGRPLLVNRGYVVDDVTDESGGVITVHLRAEDHGGVPFAPGQF